MGGFIPQEPGIKFPSQKTKSLIKGFLILCIPRKPRSPLLPSPVRDCVQPRTCRWAPGLGYTNTCWTRTSKQPSNQTKQTQTQQHNTHTQNKYNSNKNNDTSNQTNKTNRNQNRIQRHKTTIMSYFLWTVSFSQSKEHDAHQRRDWYLAEPWSIVRNPKPHGSFWMCLFEGAHKKGVEKNQSTKANLWEQQMVTDFLKLVINPESGCLEETFYLAHPHIDMFQPHGNGF